MRSEVAIQSTKCIAGPCGVRPSATAGTSVTNFGFKVAEPRAVPGLLRLRRATLRLAALILLLSPGLQAAPSSSHWLKSWADANPVWRGVHLSVRTENQAADLVAVMPKLRELGVNVLVAEVDYAYDFKSHPEVRADTCISKKTAAQLTQVAHTNGIRLIPELNCLGHQSWGKVTVPLLLKHPEFDETPGRFPENKGIYCRSWCPQNPKVNKLVFDLIDELIEGFQADAFHAGMDEVFLIGSVYCPRCQGADPAKMFAKAVNDLHRHISGKRRLEMLIWGDRLLDASTLGYSEWEGSKNGTFHAVDSVPKEIIVCDWHYGKKSDYPSVTLLLEKGFRVWPSGWQPAEASQAFSAFARQVKHPRMLGYLCTTWGKVPIAQMAEWPPIKDVLPTWK